MGRNKRDEDLQKWTGKAKTKTGGKCDSSLSAGRKQATRLEMLQGILWPEKVWQRVKGKQERPPKGLVTVPWQGTQIKGYLLDVALVASGRLYTLHFYILHILHILHCTLLTCTLV